MKVLLVFFAFVLISCVFVHASDMALYNGHTNPDWYVEDTMNKDVDKIKTGVKGLKEIVSFTDGGGPMREFQTWVEKNLSDKEMDIIWLNGCMPSILYPNPNKMPDKSLAEEWLNNGNMFINVADWFAYCTYENGIRGADNGAAGAENILNLPGVIKSFDNYNLTKSDACKQYMPSLPSAMITDRPVIYNAVKSPWEIAEIFGYFREPDGYIYGMDPCVIHNKTTNGYVAFINQANKGHSVDRAQATIEFINNWVATKVGFSVSDTTPPVGTIKINNGADYTNTTSVKLSLTGSDDTGITTVSIWGDVADPYTTGWPVVDKQVKLKDGDGTKTVYARFMDKAGNISPTVSDAIILDTTKPTSIITDPRVIFLPNNPYDMIDGSGGTEIYQVIRGVYGIKGTADDANFMQYILEYGLGSQPTKWYSIGVNPRTAKVVSGTLGTWDTSTVTDGFYTIRLTVTDKAGNSSINMSTVFSDGVYVTVDNKNPTSIITTPTQNQIINGIYNIKGTADDGNFMQYILEYGIGTQPATWYNIGVNPRTAKMLSGTLGTWDTNTVADGVYTVRLIVEDEAGNSSISSVNVTVDNKNPICLITAPTQNQIINGIYNIRGTADDPNLWQYELKYGIGTQPDNQIKWYDIGTNPRNAKVVSGNLGEWNTNTVIDGVYTIKLTVLDTSGKESENSVTVTIQNKAPIFNTEFIYNFDDGNIDDFQVYPWDGGTVPGQVVYNMCEICGDFGVCNTCDYFDNVIRLEPNPGTGLGMRFPSVGTGLKLLESIVLLRVWMLSDDVETGLLVTDRIAREGENPMQFDYFGFFVMQIGQSWYLVIRTNGSPIFDRMFQFPVQQKQWYNYALELNPISQNEFDCHLYIDGTDRTNIRLNTGTMDLNNAFVYLTADRKPSGNTAGLFDWLDIELKYICSGTNSTDQVPPSGSVVINNGAEYTSSRTVALYMTGEDYESGLDMVAIDGDIDKLETKTLIYDWLPSNATSYNLPNVVLAGGDGAKTVAAIFVDRACKKSPKVRDTINFDGTTPNVNITQLVSGASVSGVINFRAAVSDNIGIRRVEFQCDGSKVQEFPESSSSPVKNKTYPISWDTTTVVNGYHYLTVLACDLAGNCSSSGISVNISNIQVWPGDTNNDGLVDGKDVLPIGQYWGITGNARRSISCGWVAQTSQKWNPEEATYANANGDGTINESDIQCIVANWGRSRSVSAPERLNPVIDYLQYTTAYEEILKFLESKPNTEPVVLMRELLRDVISMSKSEITPDMTAFFQNYPNPFNPDTWMPYQLKDGSEITVSIFNISGELIRKLELGYKSAGFYLTKDRAAYWNGRNNTGEEMPSGLYFCMIQARSFASIRKIALVN